MNLKVYQPTGLAAIIPTRKKRNLHTKSQPPYSTQHTKFILDSHYSFSKTNNNLQKYNNHTVSISSYFLFIKNNKLNVAFMRRTKHCTCHHDSIIFVMT